MVEGGCDIGGATATLIAAGLLAIGMPLGVCILLSLLAAPASFLLLRRYFAAAEPRAERPDRRLREHQPRLAANARMSQSMNTRTRGDSCRFGG